MKQLCFLNFGTAVRINQISLIMENVQAQHNHEVPESCFIGVSQIHFHP